MFSENICNKLAIDAELCTFPTTWAFIHEIYRLERVTPTMELGDAKYEGGTDGVRSDDITEAIRLSVRLRG